MTRFRVWQEHSGSDVVILTPVDAPTRRSITLDLDEVRQLVDDLIPMLSPSPGSLQEATEGSHPAPHTASCFEELLERVSRLEESAEDDRGAFADLTTIVRLQGVIVGRAHP